MEISKDIVISGLSVSFSSSAVFDNFSATFKGGAVNCILGPSGCGKTTLLNVIAGIVRPAAGTISGTSSRSMGYAFQEPRLLPWKTAVGNVEFALPGDMPVKERRDCAIEWLSALEMAPHAEMMPSALSGGMAQRVSLARAMAGRPDILLLDEPFSALDAALKENVASRLSQVWRQRGMTVIMVTHLAEEALSVGDTFTILGNRPAKVLYQGEEIERKILSLHQIGEDGKDIVASCQAAR